MALLKTSMRIRWHLAVLAFALVFVQSVGMLHSIVHAPMLHGPGHAQAQASVQHAAGGTEDPSGFTAHLFDDHAGHGGSTGSSVDCQLFDQCSHVDGLCQVHTLVLPAQLPWAQPAVHVGLAAIRWLAAFHARGPPAFR